jgi:indole-3-glycerol phosphate synthase
LTEVHDQAELDRALAAGALIIGINNRNLADFSVSLATTEILAPRIPARQLVVAESGIPPAPMLSALRAGAQAVLSARR